MCNRPNWLPPLILFTQYGGDWDQYLEAIYSIFKVDFIDSNSIFRGRPLRLKRHPMSYGKEATFWHMISDGEDEENRNIDFRRCERIRWPKPIIEHSTEVVIKVWENVRTTKKGPQTRICLWIEAQEYLFILADRGEYLLPWTAYMVTKTHQKDKLQKEFEEYCKKQ